MFLWDIPTLHHRKFLLLYTYQYESFPVLVHIIQLRLVKDLSIQWAVKLNKDVSFELQLQLSVVKLTTGSSLLKNLLTSSFIPTQIFGIMHSMKYFLLRQLYLDSNAFSTWVNPTSSVTDSRWQLMAIISPTFLVIFWTHESCIFHVFIHSSVALSYSCCSVLCMLFGCLSSSFVIHLSFKGLFVYLSAS